jgi:hypothetical protein
MVGSMIHFIMMLVFDLHQRIEFVEHMALEKLWLGLNTKYKLVLFGS